MSGEATTITLRNGNLTVDVLRLGGALAGAWFEGDAFLGGSEHAVACFPLVPFGNRIADNTFVFDARTYRFQPNTAGDPLYLHGDGWLGEWDVSLQAPDRLTLRFERSADAVSPYAYAAVQDIQLGAEGLMLALAVTNTGPETLPFGIGLHPFFPKTKTTRVTAAARRMWSEAPGHLPGSPGSIPADLDFTLEQALPARWVNNAFEGWDGHAAITWPDRDLSLAIAASSVFRHYMVYQPDSAAFFCFEPMSHLPNGHNLPASGGLDCLAPGETLSGSITFSPRRLVSGEKHDG